MTPMLAYTIEDTSKLPYPVLCSVKLDGIRALVVDGVVYSRSIKPIRSKAVQELFGKPEYNGLDGELLYGDWNAPNVFNLTTQTVMATELKPEFSKDKITYAVFDRYDHEGGNYHRTGLAETFADSCGSHQIIPVRNFLVDDEEKLMAYESLTLLEGYEGIMVRNLDGRYKQGRSTLKEGTIGKLKRFSDDEAIVIGFEEKLHPPCQLDLGCECKGIRFTMGSGFDDAGRAEVWTNKEKYLGKLAKFKYFEIGMKDSYRFPIFQGWRDEEDMS